MSCLPLSDEAAARLRAATPAAQAFVHFNHASHSLADQSVFDAERAFLDLEARVGMHRALDTQHDALAMLPGALGRLLGVPSERIALTESASRGWTLAFSAIAPAQRMQVFVSPHEWGGNVSNVLATARASMVVMRGAPDANWQTVVADALSRRDPKAVSLVSLPLMSSASGVPFRLDGVADVVRDAGGWFFVDASQAVGHIPVTADAIGADGLVFQSRKWLRGPRGSGALVLSPRALAQLETPALLDVEGSVTQWDEALHTHTLKVADDARRFSLYDHHPAQRAGWIAALRVIEEVGVAAMDARACDLIAQLHAKIATTCKFASLETPRSAMLCATVQGPDTAKQIVARLWKQGVHIAHVPPLFAPLLETASPQTSRLRFSAHAINTTDEVDVLAKALNEALPL